jgi:hypothetical protein
MSITSRRGFRVFLSCLALLVLSVGMFSGPVADIDYWWHIANGRWIVSNNELPTTDPFGVYPTINEWAGTILHGQWGGQVILFLLHDAAGPRGVALFRITLLSATLILLAWRVARTDASPAMQCLVVTIGAVVLSGFTADRPQLFSLFLFSLLGLLLDVARQHRHVLWAVPPILAAWGNLHQGVILGAVVALLCLGLDAASHWRRGDGRTARQSALAALACAVAPAFSPNGFRGIGYLLWQEFEPAKQRISEFASPFLYLANAFEWPQVFAYFVFLPLLLICLLTLLRRHPRSAVVPAFLLLASTVSYRYTPFVVLLAAPLVARQLEELATERPRLRRFALAGLVMLLAFPAFLAFRGHIGAWNDAVSERHLPVALTENAKELGIGGRVFTTVNWGGYLGWELDGRARPFIDGRFMMNTAQLDDYSHMLWATPRGIELFERAAFDWVLMPRQNAFSSGQTYPLITLLGRHPDWQLRMSSEQGVLFSRR